MYFTWKSLKWWVLSTAKLILHWLKHQLKTESVILKVVNDVTAFVSFLMILHQKPVLRTVSGPVAIPKKSSSKKKKKR